MLAIENLVKVFDSTVRDSPSAVRAVDGVSLEVAEGDMFTLLGPSGCGKTTTLRSVAGLEEPTSGRIVLDSSVLFDSASRIAVSPNKRGLGMVFQSYAIWPHMDVFGNVAFPLQAQSRRKRPSRKDIGIRVERALAAVQLDHLISRPATDLSGGQQQRLALARALVMEPRLLLLDEPLSNLDAKLREQTRFELKRLQRELGVTSVYVTHDQTEALAMSSKIAVMNKGRVEQVGRPREVYNSPASRFVADFIGTSNFFEGKIGRKLPEDRYVVQTSEGDVIVPSKLVLGNGDPVTVSIRPEHLDLVVADPNKSSGKAKPNTLQGRVLARAFMGDCVEHELVAGQITLRAQCNPSISLPPDTTVEVGLPIEWCSLIPGTD